MDNIRILRFLPPTVAALAALALGACANPEGTTRAVPSGTATFVGGARVYTDIETATMVSDTFGARAVVDPIPELDFTR